MLIAFYTPAVCIDILDIACDVPLPSLAVVGSLTWDLTSVGIVATFVLKCDLRRHPDLEERVPSSLRAF